MQLLPCATFTINTQADLSQVIQRLKLHVETSRRFYSDDHAPYIGMLSTLGFKIHRIVRRRHPFLLIVHGRFEARPDGTAIYIRFGLSPATILAILSWVCLGLIGLTLPLEWLGWLPLAAYGLSLPAMVGAFWHEIYCSRRELTKILLGASLKSRRSRSTQAYKPLFMGLAGLALVVGLNQIATRQPSPALNQPASNCAEAATSPYCQLRPVYTLTGHPTAKTLAISRDGSTLVSGGRDKAIRVWDTATGQLKKTLQSESGVIRTLAIAPDGKTIVSGGGDVRVRIWDITSNQPPRVLVGHTIPINQVKISDDSKTAVSAGNGEIKIWDIATGQLKASLPESDLTVDPAIAPAVEPSIASPAKSTLDPAKTETFRLLAISPDGGTALVESGKQWLSWDIATRQTTVLQTPWADTLYGFVRNAQISLDAQSVVTTTYNHPFTHLKVWDLTTGEAQAQKQMSASDQKYWMNSVALSRDRIVGSTPEGLKIWHLPTAKLEATLAAPQMTPLVISRDGKHLAGIMSDGADTAIQVWQRPDINAPRTMPPLNRDDTTVSLITPLFFYD